MPRIVEQVVGTQGRTIEHTVRDLMGIVDGTETALNAAAYKNFINTGSTASVTHNGVLFEPDIGFSGGTANTSPNTLVPEPYRSERWGAEAFGNPITYTRSVPKAGRYRVTYFGCEIAHDAVGVRSFHILANGKIPVPFKDIDIFARAGGKFIPYSTSAVVESANNQIVLTFQVQADAVSIAAIGIEEVSLSTPLTEVYTPPPPPPPPPPGSRDLWLLPGYHDAVVNMPMGRTAPMEYTVASERNFYSSPPDWNIGFVRASSNDPFRTIRSHEPIIPGGGHSLQWRVPTWFGNQHIPAGMGLNTWGDRHVNLFNADASEVLELYNAQVHSDGTITTGRTWRNPTRMHGMPWGPQPVDGSRGGSRYSGAIGIVRRHEIIDPNDDQRAIVNARIPHGLGIALRGGTDDGGDLLGKFADPPYVFPARQTDNHGLYGRAALMGYAYAIPYTQANVDWVNGLPGGNREQIVAKAIARCLLEYPAVTVDSSGGGPGWYADFPMPDWFWHTAHNDTTGIMSQAWQRTRRITGQNEGTWNTQRAAGQGYGGGSPVVPYSAAV